MRRFGLALSMLFVSLLSSRASGQAQTLFFEDFETGGSGWTEYFCEDPCPDCCPDPSPLWHVSSNGECGSVTRMAAYNHTFCNPTCNPCTYDADDTDGANNELFVSPVFTFSGAPPFTVHFDYRKDMDVGDIVTVSLYDVVGEFASPLYGPYDSNSSTVQPIILAIPTPENWTGRQAQVQFEFLSDELDELGFGWMIDNVRVKNSGFVTSNGRVV